MGQKWNHCSFSIILIISIILYERQLDFLFYAYLLCLEVVDIDHTINV